MNALLTVWLAAASVPAVTAGPDLAEQARPVQAPIERVTVFSDRALVKRRARVKLTPGVNTLRLPDLPGSVMRDTIRVSCRGARVIRVEAQPVERERFTIDQVENLLERIEKLTDDVSLLDARRRVFSAEADLLAGFQPRPPLAEKERVGRALPPLLPRAWAQVLDFLEQRRRLAQEELRRLDEQRRLLVDKLRVARQEASQYNMGGMSQRKYQVVALLQATGAGQVRLDVDYFVPGAAWWPTYDLDFQPERGRVELRSAGLVRQASGEDWQDVKLVLSTALPGLGIELPELLTWTLGERRQFTPRVRPARMPPEARLHPPPVAGPTPAEAERQARREVLRNRVAELQRLAALDTGVALDGRLAADLQSVTTGKGEGRGLVGGLARPAQKGYYPPRRSAPQAAPPPPPREEYEEAEMALAEARPSAPRPLARPSRRARGKRRGRRGPRARAMQLFDVPLERPRLNDPTLPAVLAAGLDYRWTSATRISVPSSGKRIKVPLSVENFSVETFYEATPALKDRAYLKALVRNRRRRPILAGPMNIFVAGDFTGQGRLRTTGPGGTLELALGADEDIRFKRRVVPRTETKGVFSKDDVTTYTVTIEVGNYKKRRVKVAVYDVLPRAGSDKVEVEKVRIEPRPASGPDREGVLRWDLDLRPGATTKVQLVYRITRPHDWQLYQ